MILLVPKRSLESRGQALPLDGGFTHCLLPSRQNRAKASKD